MKHLPNIIYWVARLVAALVLFQTLFFKFSGAEESVYIFTKVGMEPWGRIAVGIFELVAGVLLLIPATAWLGGLVALGLMSGAIGLHLTVLGIAVKGDGGYLFLLAVVVAICSAYILIRNTEKIFGAIAITRQKVS